MKTKYKDRGFTITDYHGNNEFYHLRNFAAPAHLHTCATNDHIGYIKRFIRKIKEQVRRGCHSIPDKKSLKSMTIYLLQDMITCLNISPSKNRISSDLSQSAIVIGSPNTDYNKLKVTFGNIQSYTLAIQTAKTDNGRDNRTNTSKHMGRILFYFSSHR